MKCEEQTASSDSADLIVRNPLKGKKFIINQGWHEASNEPMMSSFCKEKKLIVMAGPFIRTNTDVIFHQKMLQLKALALEKNLAKLIYT